MVAPAASAAIQSGFEKRTSVFLLMVSLKTTLTSEKPVATIGAGHTLLLFYSLMLFIIVIGRVEWTKRSLHAERKVRGILHTLSQRYVIVM